jgi:hypothetical protein
MAIRLPEHPSRDGLFLGLAMGALSIAADILKWPSWSGYIFLGLFVVFMLLALMSNPRVRQWRARRGGLVAELPSEPHTVGLDLRGGSADLEDTEISGTGTGIRQSGGKLRSKRLSIDGEPHGEKKEGID